jgi:hypothetical protein
VYGFFFLEVDISKQIKHKSSNKTRQLVLVNLHSSDRVPYNIVVIVGEEPYACCRFVACYLLTKTQIILPS